ncbi:MAG TPA: YqgQ family protein [Bacillota bacterium]|nr:YqgQ family protein [Bacillota bacterium]
METIYDIQQLLKNYGTILYTGNRLADIHLMESDIQELYQYQFISKEDYMKAIVILKHEAARLDKKKGAGETWKK